MIPDPSRDPAFTTASPGERVVRARVAEQFPPSLRNTAYFDEAVAAVQQARAAGSRAPLPELIRWHVSDQTVRFRFDVLQVVRKLLDRDPIPGLRPGKAAYATVVRILLSDKRFDPEQQTSVRAWVRGFAKLTLARFKARRQRVLADESFSLASGMK